jgi:hypothetical protein
VPLTASRRLPVRPRPGRCHGLGGGSPSPQSRSRARPGRQAAERRPLADWPRPGPGRFKKSLTIIFDHPPGGPRQIQIGQCADEGPDEFRSSFGRFFVSVGHIFEPYFNICYKCRPATFEPKSKNIVPLRTPQLFSRIARKSFATFRLDIVPLQKKGCSLSKQNQSTVLFSTEFQ